MQTGKRFPVPLRYADTDQMGYIYFARHLFYADEGIMAFLKARGVDLLALERLGTPVAVVAAEIQYRSPLRYGQACEVEVALERVGETSLALGFQIYGDGVLASQGQVVYVFIDATGQKVPVPEGVRQALEEGA